MEQPAHALNRKLTQALRQCRRLGLGLLLLAILLAAHDVIPGRGGWTLWRLLVPFGLDVSMTPFTVDMMFMSPASRVRARPLYLRIRTVAANQFTRPARELDFYSLKLPLLLLSELAQAGADVEGHIVAVCRALTHDLREPVEQWSVQDVEYRCAR